MLFAHICAEVSATMRQRANAGHKYNFRLHAESPNKTNATRKSCRGLPSDEPAHVVVGGTAGGAAGATGATEHALSTCEHRVS